MIPTLSPRVFALGGNSTFTVKSLKTGTHFTYKVRQPKGKPHFVSVLTGSDNENDFTFLGTIFDGRAYVPSRRNIAPTAPSAIAFDYVWNRIDSLPANVEFHHEGRCACCGRKLTTPESVARGIGPECASKLGM
jgi:hypothetical protein